MADLRAGVGGESAQLANHGDFVDEAELDAGEPEGFGFVVGLAAGEEEGERVFGGFGD